MKRSTARLRDCLLAAIASAVMNCAAYAQTDPTDPLAAAFARMMAEPGNPDAALDYARIAAAGGETRAAITALERILRANPSLDNIRLELASLYLAAGSLPARLMWQHFMLERRFLPQRSRRTWLFEPGNYWQGQKNRRPDRC